MKYRQRVVSYFAAREERHVCGMEAECSHLLDPLQMTLTDLTEPAPPPSQKDGWGEPWQTLEEEHAYTPREPS